MHAETQAVVMPAIMPRQQRKGNILSCCHAGHGMNRIHWLAWQNSSFHQDLGWIAERTKEDYYPDKTLSNERHTSYEEDRSQILK